MATASTFAGTLKKYDIHNTKQSSKWVYTAITADRVAAATQETFRIPSRGISGLISEIYFESASLDCNVWISEFNQDPTTGEKQTNNETIIAMDGIVTGYSPELATPRKYHNRDAAPVQFVYLTVDNDDGANATGDWVLVITYDKE